MKANSVELFIMPPQSESIGTCSRILFSANKSKSARIFFENLLQAVYVVHTLIIEACCSKP